ncbi:ABC transporter permease subunit [Klebsiella pneumoniae subsp. pneumoniae]|nr:ABC transporter permease subunit [Klebsiella pneumoniae subsp. pneumoniae]
MPAPVAIIIFALIAWQISQPRHGGRHSGIADCHRRHRRVVASHGHSGAGPHRPAVLHGYRLAAGDLASAQPAGGENHPPAVGCHADHAGVRLSGADRMLFGIGNVPGVVVTIIFALPPIVRLTILGINQVPADLIEASRSFGASPRQLLFRCSCRWPCPPLWPGLTRP